MNNSLQFGGMKVGRLTLHVAFWIVVFAFFTIIYAIKSTYLVAARNNLFYVPIHMAYFYAIAYWLIPVYLLTARYLKFALYLIVLIFFITVISRLIDIWIVVPYTIKNVRDIDWDYIEISKQTFWQKLSSPLYFINALKAVNLVVWFAVVIKLFKLWYERKQAALQAELNGLKGQVHPHFLFNTLNNLYALTLNNSPKSPQVVLGLSGLLRYMLYECNTDSVPLSKEILMLQQFISLEKLRYEDRLDLTFNIYGNPDHKMIAPLLMLPLIENAFKHGTSEKIGQAWININLYIEEDDLRLKVSNSKPDMTTTDAEKYIGHIGLTNLQKRLNLLYPATHKLKIMDDEDAFLAILELKLQTHPVTPLVNA
ncbi:sensor histidine kinase [Mucilaginibacter boryungensis]|uniref:Histidine kinase n=1 Tax=Mucilaginibacter boryungensis TaxID=768480 RepID=A0ABR9XHK0_9SPHI|nr:histidine kinase [Mucilaginibacter boryungensis]MBE9666695.1 histidine kinase [Mucilaginibacter boryungensis]